MTSSHEQTPDPLQTLTVMLEKADSVIENTLCLHRCGKQEYETEKHEAFKHLFEVICGVKNLLAHEHPDLNTQPISRLIEDFRDTFEGAKPVLICHRNPALAAGGKPKLASNNEASAALIAAVALLQKHGSSLGRAIERVATEADVPVKKIHRWRSRFNRRDGVNKLYKDLATRLSILPDGYDLERYFSSLIIQYQRFTR